jgi:class III poly(R)-hydroxyalkanoic acid synthase PhaE subunit
MVVCSDTVYYMPTHGPDMFDAYQTLMKDGWETWLRQVDPDAKAPGLDEKAAVARMLDGIRDYSNWIQSTAAAAATAQPAWQPPPMFNGAPGVDVGNARFEAWLKATQEWLGSGVAGFSPEQQDDQQALLRASMAYAEHQQRYQHLLAGIQARGLQALQERIAQGQGGDLESMRKLYDAWVEVAEQAYNEAALSTEFRDVYAAMVNAQVHLRSLQQGQFSRVVEQLGMPGRGDIDALAKALQEVRREVQVLKAATAKTPVVKKAAVKKAAPKAKR